MTDYTSWCTLARWRTLSGFSDSDIGDSAAQELLNQAHRQVQREGFYFIREELSSVDDNDRYFVLNRYITDSNIDGSVDASDITVYEWDATNKVLVDISDGISEVNSLNSYFTLASGYPTESRQVFTNYWIARQPIGELVGEGGILEEAVAEFCTYLHMRKLKLERLSRGVVSWSAGGEQVTRDEKTFDDMIINRKRRYDALINRIKPFMGRRIRVGRGQFPVGNQNRIFQQQPLTYRGRLNYN